MIEGRESRGGGYCGSVLLKRRVAKVGICKTPQDSMHYMAQARLNCQWLKTFILVKNTEAHH